jgi:hypothetical protein
MRSTLRLVICLVGVIVSVSLPGTASSDVWYPLDFVWFPYTQKILMGDRVESAPVVMLRLEDDLLRWRVELQTRHGDVQYFDTGRITLDRPEHCTRINISAENQDSQFPEPGVFYDLERPPSLVIRNPPPRSELGDVLGRFRASVALGLAQSPPPAAIGDDERMLCTGVAIAAGSSNRASLDLDVLSLDGERWGKARSKFSRKIDASHLVYVPLTVLADIPVMLAEVVVFGGVSLMGLFR